jgi:hypothetical protein
MSEVDRPDRARVPRRATGIGFTRARPYDDRRARTRGWAVTATADALLRRLREERELPVGERTTRASDDSLDRAANLVAGIAEHLAEKSSPGTLPEQVGRLVTDSWDWRSGLTTEVLRYAQAVRPLVERWSLGDSNP